MSRRASRAARQRCPLRCPPQFPPLLPSSTARARQLLSRGAAGAAVWLIALPAFAQAAPAGKGFWDTLINLLYGWPGLLIGLLFFLAAVYLWVKEGALPAVMTGLAGVILFFSPAVAQYLQQQGSASTQNIAPVKQ